MTSSRSSQVGHHPRCILVTGGAGFIGCNLTRYLLGAHAEVRVVVLDCLTYAGSLDNLQQLPSSAVGRFRFIAGDILDQELVAGVFQEERCDTVIHLAAESHVDRSIDDPLGFVRTNVLGTGVLLDVARRQWAGRPAVGPHSVRFHQVSTDEVFGSLGASGRFDERSPYDPSSPYAASKAASDHLVRAWGRTYGLPVTISHCSNNYGPYQFPEKLLPVMITNALSGRTLPIYGHGRQVRDWLHVEDHGRALDTIVRWGVAGESYGVGGGNEWTNLALVERCCQLLDELRPDPQGSYRRLIRHVQDRPGHDARYAMDASRLTRELGWVPRHSLESGLRATIQWYLDQGPWLEAIGRDRYQGQRLGSLG